MISNYGYVQSTVGWSSASSKYNAAETSACRIVRYSQREAGGVPVFQKQATRVIIALFSCRDGGLLRLCVKGGLVCERGAGRTATFGG